MLFTTALLKNKEKLQHDNYKTATRSSRNSNKTDEHKQQERKKTIEQNINVTSTIENQSKQRAKNYTNMRKNNKEEERNKKREYNKKRKGRCYTDDNSEILHKKRKYEEVQIKIHLLIFKIDTILVVRKQKKLQFFNRQN